MEESERTTAARVVISNVRAILRLGGGSRSGIPPDRLDIGSEITETTVADFTNNTSTREVAFTKASKCRRIDGIHDFPLIFQIEIPRSVELIDFNAFYRCAALTSVFF
jgi:hypothetical protein